MDGVRERPLQMLFVHSALDEYGLSPYEFRVYARLVRRAGRGAAYESIASMAVGCQMSERKLKDALNLLVAAGLVTKSVQAGRGAIYTLTPPECWLAPQALPQVRARVMAYRSGSAKNLAGGVQSTPVGEDPGVPGTPVDEGPQVPGTCHLGTGHPSGEVPGTHEGYPTKAVPEENPQTHLQQEAPAARVCAPAAGFSDTLLERFEAFWQRLRPEYRGDRQPALKAFLQLNPTELQLAQIVAHREAWEKRAADAEKGVTGWVPKPKHLANYLRQAQFETPLPEAPAKSPPTPRPLPAADGSEVRWGNGPEAEQIGELKRLGIVALDLMNGRAELEDRYAFATGLTGCLRYAEILAHKQKLLALRAVAA